MSHLTIPLSPPPQFMGLLLHEIYDNNVVLITYIKNVAIAITHCTKLSEVSSLIQR
jgi:hypothetical protein